MAQRVSPAASPTRFSNKLSALGMKLSRTLSHTSEDGSEKEISQKTEKPGSPKDRSQSRGRDVYSSGRGGIGNMRPASTSRDARPTDGPDDFSPSRGRERIPTSADLAKSYSTGRGGAGNIHSPSRDARSPLRAEMKEEIEAEEIVIRAESIAEQEAPHSTGRGGYGNITTRSRSREPTNTTSPLHPVHSTGRGGVGNIIAGEGVLTDVIDDDDERRKAHHHDGGVHSTGRGGVANMTTAHEPSVERHQHQDHLGLADQGQGGSSTGRGGVGNIIRSREGSRNPRDRDGDGDRDRDTSRSRQSGDHHLNV